MRLFFVSCLVLLPPIAACGEGSDGGGGGGAVVPDSYAFDSRFADGDSVSYGGQVVRHLLIIDMKDYLAGLTAELDADALRPAPGDIAAALEDGYLSFDSEANAGAQTTLSLEPPALQTTYDEISTGKDLLGKLAGNDGVGQHRDWNAGMPGWGDGSLSPTELVRGWFAEIDALAVARAEGQPATDPDGAAIEAVYVTPEGQDLQQLLQKFLLGAIAFSQGADDYLDDDTEGKGLLSDNTAPEDGEPFTALEHAWDEGFGYFGAARDFGAYSDAQVAEGAVIDSDEDGAIDLRSEYNFGHSQNAGKRDAGASADAPTDFSGDAFDAFLEGRAIIAAADGALDADAMAALADARDRAVDAWEKAIAATVVHYINEALVDTARVGGDDYAFADHAKHWSEMKGFALCLQFNPRSPMLDDFEAFHALIGDAPALSGDDLQAYAEDLRAARDLLAAAYAFAPANLGDDNGEGGW